MSAPPQTEIEGGHQAHAMTDSKTETIRVPSVIRPGFEALGRMDDTDFRALHSEVEGAHPVNGGTDFLATASGAWSEAHREALGAVLSLLGVRRLFGWTMEKAATSVAWSTDLEIDSGQRDTLARRLQTLASTDAIWLSTRSNDIAIDNERTFHDAKTVTSMRPIFPAQRTDAVPAAVIVHELGISFHPDGDEDDTAQFRVVLTPRDIARLQAVLTRAQEKAAALEQMLDTTPALLLNARPAKEQANDHH